MKKSGKLFWLSVVAVLLVVGTLGTTALADAMMPYVTRNVQITFNQNWAAGAYGTKSSSTTKIFMFVSNSYNTAEVSTQNLTLSAQRSGQGGGTIAGNITTAPRTTNQGYTAACISGQYRAELSCGGGCVGSGYIYFE